MIETLFIEEVIHTDLTTVFLSDNLIDIQKKVDSTNVWSLPVVDDGKFQGLISKATMLDLYRKELKVQKTTRLEKVFGSEKLVNF